MYLYTFRKNKNDEIFEKEEKTEYGTGICVYNYTKGQKKIPDLRGVKIAKKMGFKNKNDEKRNGGMGIEISLSSY